MFAYSDPNMGINQSGSRSIHVNFIKSNHWKRSLNQDCMDTSQGRFERPIPKYSILDLIISLNMYVIIFLLTCVQTDS